MPSARRRQVVAGGLGDDRFVVGVDWGHAVRADDSAPQLAEVADRVAEPDEAEAVAAQVVDRLQVGRRGHHDVDTPVRHGDLPGVAVLQAQAAPARPSVGRLAMPPGHNARGVLESVERVEAGAYPDAVWPAVRDVARARCACVLGDGQPAERAPQRVAERLILTVDRGDERRQTELGVGVEPVVRKVARPAVWPAGLERRLTRALDDAPGDRLEGIVVEWAAPRPRDDHREGSMSSPTAAWP